MYHPSDRQRRRFTKQIHWDPLIELISIIWKPLYLFRKALLETRLCILVLWYGADRFHTATFVQPPIWLPPLQKNSGTNFIY